MYVGKYAYADQKPFFWQKVPQSERNQRAIRAQSDRNQTAINRNQESNTNSYLLINFLTSE
jgi:hypothetical protein